jgi:hypothetical protein
MKYSNKRPTEIPRSFAILNARSFAAVVTTRAICDVGTPLDVRRPMRFYLHGYVEEVKKFNSSDFGTFDTFWYLKPFLPGCGGGIESRRLAEIFKAASLARPE